MGKPKELQCFSCGCVSIPDRTILHCVQPCKAWGTLSIHTLRMFSAKILTPYHHDNHKCPYRFLNTRVERAGWGRVQRTPSLIKNLFLFAEMEWTLRKWQKTIINLIWNYANSKHHKGSRDQRRWKVQSRLQAWERESCNLSQESSPGWKFAVTCFLTSIEDCPPPVSWLHQLLQVNHILRAWQCHL